VALKEWAGAGFDFKMDWLLRNINTVLTGEALFSALKDVSAAEFQQAFKQTQKVINYLLNVVGGRLGLDHDRVLGGYYAFPIMSRYVAQQGGKLANASERDKLLYWYVHSMLWGRFAGSTESTLNQDLAVMESSAGALDRLIDQLRISRGDLQVRPENFASWSLGARFYPMLYLLTRVGSACDWDTGLPLKAHLLGKVNHLQIHHIFPKSRLYERGHDRSQVNALANFCFLTQVANLGISNKLPELYFPEIEAKHPGALASQWIPMDPQLWRMENYLDFLAARQKLLAEAANGFLNSLLSGPAPETADVPVTLLSVPVSSSVNDEAEVQLLGAAVAWVAEQGLPEGDRLYELNDAATGDLLAVLDLAWPEGLQTGFSAPVALIIAEDVETLEVASRAGFRCFTDLMTFQAYVEAEILALEVA
jgi:hypothetical protein